MNSLWSFSLTLYRAEEVKQLCLQLQEEAEIDICLFLSLVWLGTNGTSLDRPTMISLYHSIARWQALVTARLRATVCLLSIMIHLKTNTQPAETATLLNLEMLELNAEKATFWRINQFLQTVPQANGQPVLERQAIAIEHNLASYFALDTINGPRRHKSEQISRILLNYLPS